MSDFYKHLDHCDKCDALCDAEYALCDDCQEEVITRLDAENYAHDPVEIIWCPVHGETGGNGCPQCQQEGYKQYNEGGDNHG